MQISILLICGFSGLLVCWSGDLMKMYHGKVIYVVMSFFEKIIASLPGLIDL